MSRGARGVAVIQRDARNDPYRVLRAVVAPEFEGERRLPRVAIGHLNVGSADYLVRVRHLCDPPDFDVPHAPRVLRGLNRGLYGRAAYFRVLRSVPAISAVDV